MKLVRICELLFIHSKVILSQNIFSCDLFRKVYHNQYIYADTIGNAKAGLDANHADAPRILINMTSSFGIKPKNRLLQTQNLEYVDLIIENFITQTKLRSCQLVHYKSLQCSKHDMYSLRYTKCYRDTTMQTTDAGRACRFVLNTANIYCRSGWVCVTMVVYEFLDPP